MLTQARAEKKNTMKRPLRALLAVFVLSLFLGCNNYHILDKLENPGGVGKGMPPTTPCTTCFIFVTNTTSKGNLGGIAGADSKCMADGARPNNSVYKALLSDGSSRMACSESDCTADNTGQSDWVIKPMTQYINANGQNVFYSNGYATYDFAVSFTNPVVATLYYVWTGLNASWGSSGSNCTAWTDDSTGNFGEYGTSNDVNSTFLFTSPTDYCGGSRHLYCVEQ